MVMPHPILPVGLPPASVAMAMNHMSQLSDLANMAVVSQVHTEESKVKASSSKSTRANAKRANAKGTNASSVNITSTNAKCVFRSLP